MNINWNEIKEKYPKSYNKAIFANASYWETETQKITKQHEQDVIDYLCYCSLENFFDKNSIEIFIKKLYKTNHKKTWLKEGNYRYWILIHKKINVENITHKINIKSEIITSQRCYASRNESKEQAILKSFEILEKQLEEKK